MSRFFLTLKILGLGLLMLSLSGCIIGAVAAGAAGGTYYEKHKNDAS